MISFVTPGKGPNHFNLQTGKEVIAMKILLVCAGGMSTSVLMKKMEKEGLIVIVGRGSSKKYLKKN